MNNENKNLPKKNGINKKYLKIGSFNITMTAVVIAVVILLNLFISEIPETYTKFDMSQLQLYTVGEESNAVISEVDEDVTFYILAQRGAEDATITELLGKYSALNEHIKTVNIDPITNPTFISKYTSETLSSNSVIAESGKRFYCVDYYDIYRTEYSEEELYAYYYYGQMPSGTPYFYGELMFTTALDYVTRDEIPTVYSLSGHGETALSDTMASYIASENIGRGELSLLTVEAIPADCTSILINNPTSDISSQECEMLKAYLDEGGGIILVTSCVSYNSAAMPNLTLLCAYMGLEPIDGIVVEGSKNNYIGDPRNLFPNLGSAESGPLSLLSSTNIYVMMSAAHGIVSDGTHAVNGLLSTTSSAYVKKDYMSSSIDKVEGDIEGTVYVGASVAGAADGARSDEYKFVWFSSQGIVDEGSDMYVSGGNSAVFMSSLNWMSENKINLSILAKQLQVAPLTLTEADSNIWSAIVVIIIPLSVIGIGFAVWFKRRKK